MSIASHRSIGDRGLIVSPDPMAAALMAAALEVAGIAPRFAQSGEPARSALLRHRPSYFVLDCTDAVTAEASLLGPAIMIGAKLVLFGAEQHVYAIARALAAFEPVVIALPRDAPRLTEILRGARESILHQRESTGL